MARQPGTGAQATRPARLAEAHGVPSRAAVAHHPVHPMIIPFPIALLTAALVADIAYAVTGTAAVAHAAAWLLGAGLAMGAVAMVPGAIDFFLIRRARSSRAGKVHAIGNGVVLVLAAANLVARLVWGVEAAVVPVGLALSAVTGALLGVTGWYGGELSYRLLVGVDPTPAAHESEAPQVAGD